MDGPAASLSDGLHSLTARASNVSGTSTASTVLSLTIDTVIAEPGALSLSTGSDTGVQDGRYTSLTMPTLTGTAEANATITLYDAGVAVGTALGDGGGRWSVTARSLVTGDHTLTVRAVDVADNSSSSSSALMITIDTPPPMAPAGPTLSHFAKLNA